MKVSTELQRHTEPLEADEIAFLERKEEKGRKLYYLVYRIMMVLSFVFPYLAAWYRVTEGAPNAFSYTKFFASAGVLLLISSISIYIPYRLDIKKVQKDLVSRTKIVEKSHVTRKVYFPAINTYFFYIDSKSKMSIEVSVEDFNRMKEGDEVCIEYTTHAKEYLGYF